MFLICDTVTGGSVVASGAQPPVSVTNLLPVVFGVKFIVIDTGQSQVWRQHTAYKFIYVKKKGIHSENGF